MKKITTYLHELQEQKKLTTTNISLAIFGILLFLALAATLPRVNRSANDAITQTNAALVDLTGHVNPFIGTARDGNTFPGAVYPRGMVEWSPDTTSDSIGNYKYTDTMMSGLSLTHFSGGGCRFLQDIPIMPYSGSITTSPRSNPTQYYSQFSHTNESARPGYYRVYLDSPKVNVELTATARSGYGRFTYPASDQSVMLINSGGSGNGVGGDIESSVNIVGNNKITGSARANGGCGVGGKTTLYFSAEFDQPFIKKGTWNNTTITNDSTGTNGQFTGAFVTFDTRGTNVVHMKIGLSYVSIANAQANLQAENPGNDFQAIVTKASDAWNAKLNKIILDGGTNDQKTNFYTALYHAYMQPKIFSDVNGEYLGFDNQVHTVPAGHIQYEIMPTWDQYRSYPQLMAIIDPEETSDILQSLVNNAQQGDGHLPRWSQGIHDYYIMSGDGPSAYIASAYALGAKNFDTAGALKAMTDGQAIGREGYTDYVNLGYVPVGIVARGGGAQVSASMTLEYAQNDFAISQFARSLGDTNACTTYWNRSNNWQNLFHPTSKYIQPRMRDGSWQAGFDPLQHDLGFHEGNSAEYTWLVQGHLSELIQKLGGKDAAIQRLNGIYGAPNIGNEHLYEIPWVHNFAQNPPGTAKIVRETLLQKFFNTPDGLHGNDDAGAMASWHIFAALGLYPEIIGVDGLTVSAPLFRKATINLANGKTIEINAPNAADANFHIQGLRVNGQGVNGPWISWNTLKDGGVVDFDLGSTPSSWGTNAQDAPPSFSSVQAACSQSTLTAAPTPIATSNFVTRCGKNFCSNGQPWYLYGASIYGQLDNPANAAAMAKNAKLNTIRIINFFHEDVGIDTNTEPYREPAWVRVDTIIAEAAKANLKVLLDLSTYRNMLYNNNINPYTKDWNQFVTFIANRRNTVTNVLYKDDPTIALVSFAGEVEPPNGSNSRGATQQNVTDFFKRTAAQWKAVDPKHLVNSGGFLHLDDQNSGIDWKTIFADPNIDACSIHNYSNNDTNITTPNVANYCGGINKPWVTEEFGWEQVIGDSQRANNYQSMYNLQKQYTSAGIAFWNLGTEFKPNTYDVNANTPLTLSVVQQNAPTIITPTNAPIPTNTPIPPTPTPTRVPTATPTSVPTITPTPLACKTSSATFQNTSIPSQSGQFTLTFNATPNQANMDGVIGISQSPVTAYTGLAAIVRFNTNGVIDARKGSAYAADAAIPYTPGVSYKFRMVVNVPSHTYTVYITPSGGTERLLATNYPFRTEQASVTSLANIGYVSIVGTNTVCNPQVNGVSNPTPTPTRVPTPTPAQGIRGTYFNNKTLSGSPVVNRVDPMINFFWGNGAPSSLLSNDLFSARWTGNLTAKTTGTYQIYVKSDDGVRLWFNNQLKVDKWQNQSPTEYRVSVSLTANTKYPLKIEYFENTGGAEIQLLWSGTNITKQPIPQSALSL